MAQVVEQIGGAVHRVQDPNWAGEVHAGVVLLLPHELDLRGQGGQMALQLVLHRGVHGGDEVGGPLRRAWDASSRREKSACKPHGRRHRADRTADRTVGT